MSITSNQATTLTSRTIDRSEKKEERKREREKSKNKRILIDANQIEMDWLAAAAAAAKAYSMNYVRTYVVVVQLAASGRGIDR